MHDVGRYQLEVPLGPLGPECLEVVRFVVVKAADVPQDVVDVAALASDLQARLCGEDEEVAGVEACGVVPRECLDCVPQVLALGDNDVPRFEAVGAGGEANRVHDEFDVGVGYLPARVERLASVAKLKRVRYLAPRDVGCGHRIVLSLGWCGFG